MTHFAVKPVDATTSSHAALVCAVIVACTLVLVLVVSAPYPTSVMVYSQWLPEPEQMNTGSA